MGFDPVSYLIGKASGGGGGGGTTDISIYGDLFKYCLLSIDSTDKFNRDNRYFTRNTNEPVIVIPAGWLNDEVLSYTGYGVISFSSNGVTGTYNTYGNLENPVSKTTPSGTNFYIQTMSGMYPISTASNKLKLQYGNNAKNTLEFVIDDTKLYYNNNFKSFAGDADIISALYNLIDSVYTDYYSL